MEQTNGNRWERPDAPLGTLVYRAGLLSKDKLEAALEEGQRSGRRLGEILLQKGWIDEKDLARLLAGQRGLAFVSLKGRGYEIQAARLLPERVCRYHNAMPIEVSGESVLVAIADPTDEGANGEIRDELQREVNLVVATASEIRAAIDDVYGAGQATQVALAPASAPTAISPIVADHGLRIAAPEPAAEPAPAPEPEPEAAHAHVEPEPEPALAHVEPEPEHVEPEPQPAAAEPALTPVPTPQPYAEPEREPGPDPVRELEAAPAPLHEPLPVLPGHETPAAGPVPELPELPELPEPTIERNEDAHVSVAFHPAQAPEPVQAAPVPVPVPVQAQHTPVLAEPEPVQAQPEPVRAEPEHAPAATPTHDTYRLVINLEGDEEVDIAHFADESEAVAAARELVAGIAKDGEWPQVGTKFLPPNRIVSVEIREKAVYAGSRDRADWGSGS